MTLCCGYRQCLFGNIDLDGARHEIKAAKPEGWAKIYKTMVIKWKANGEAAFHPPCWRKVLIEARKKYTGDGKGKAKQKNKTGLKATEKSKHQV